MNNLGMNDGSSVKCLNRLILCGWIHSVDIDLEGKVKYWMNSVKAIVRSLCLEMTYLIKGRKVDKVFGFRINALFV